MREKYGFLSGFGLKWIAICSMLIDHIGSFVMDGAFEPYRIDGYLYFTPDMPFFIRNGFVIKSICDILGSIAFPIFCFLIVEGVLHTRNIVRYGVFMGFFALVSEIPYNLARYKEIFAGECHNVMFTLCVGIFTLYLLRKTEAHFFKWNVKRILLAISIIVAGMMLAFLIKGEYVFLGVLSISLLYLLRKNRYLQLLGFAPLMIASPWIVLAVIPVLLYNGTRGKGSKYFFYVFYPGHFLMIAWIAAWLANLPV